MQEFDFNIIYRKGSLNANADALSRQPLLNDTPVAITVSRQSCSELRQAQKDDSVISTIYRALRLSKDRPRGHEWKSSPLHRYAQMWPQFVIVDGIVCRRYKPDPSSPLLTVPLLPPNLRGKALEESHSGRSSGHLGPERTLYRLQKEAYWVYMARDVTKFYRQCTRCQQAKSPKPTRAPLTSTPIGRPWQMVAVDVLEVPLSTKNNRYLLVIQDYFTKWAEAIPMPDQTASRITDELVKFFCQDGTSRNFAFGPGTEFRKQPSQADLRGIWDFQVPYHSLSSPGGWDGRTVEPVNPANVTVLCGHKGRVGAVPTVGVVCVSYQYPFIH